ncbi:MAG: T9SS type A sorting domain-containing protein, partial [Romboutsia sp.]|nr:T9SS type A sorting domain-containing protein [Romboutsia sp.]
SSNQTFKYIVTFENVDTADLPAQTVIVKNQLDTNLLDMNTLSLGIVHIGNKYARMKSYRKEYFTEIDLRPEKNMLVRINAALDTTGTITWTFLSIDPTTGDFITDALDGFLPPNTNPPIGEGIVSYSIAPKNNIQTNDIINNKALIYFDTNDPIETNTWTNIIDDEAPIVNLSVEQVNTTDSLMKVTLVGNDLKSGFRYFDIYYKKNNHSYKYLIRSTAGEFTMKGDVDSTYSFYAIGYDSTKNNKIYSTEESIILNELSTAINTSLVEKGIALYPNPTNGILQVAFSKPLVGKLEYIITTIEGKMIQQKVLQEQNNFFLDLTQQTNGLYFIQFKQNNEILGTAKIIKQ